MPNNLDKKSRRESIIASVNNAWGFFTLALLITEGTLALVSMKTTIPAYWPFLLLVIIVCIVAALLVIKPEAFQKDMNQKVSVYLRFGDYDDENCKFKEVPFYKVKPDRNLCFAEIADDRHPQEQKRQIPLNLSSAPEQGGWVFELDLPPNQTVYVCIVDKEGIKWTGSFPPFIRCVNALRG